MATRESEASPALLNDLALRGIINSGHTRATAFVVRTAGHEPRLFSTWGARMIALIGRLVTAGGGEVGVAGGGSSPSA